MRQQTLLRLSVFVLQTLYQICRACDLGDRTDALAAAPDFFPGPGLGALAATEAHLAWVALGQVVGIEPRRTDGALEVIAVHAREQAAVDDVVARALDDRMLVL